MSSAGSLSIADCSRSSKAGLKGPRAATWLHECGVPIPTRANSWVALPGRGVVARLGESEFLIDEAAAPEVTSRVLALLADPPARVYPVLRQDAVIALSGVRVNDVLLQTCSVDFNSLDGASDLVLTSMVGVSVLAIPFPARGVPTVKIWADPTFGPYLWRTLLGVVRALGGNIGAEPAHDIVTKELQ